MLSLCMNKRHEKNEQITFTRQTNLLCLLLLVQPMLHVILPRGTTTFHGFIANEQVLLSEVIWALKKVLSHYSLTSCKDGNLCFTAMFPDSQDVFAWLHQTCLSTIPRCCTTFFAWLHQMCLSTIPRCCTTFFIGFVDGY